MLVNHFIQHEVRESQLYMFQKVAHQNNAPFAEVV